MILVKLYSNKKFTSGKDKQEDSDEAEGILVLSVVNG